MKIRFLGTSSGTPVVERHFTSILVECQDRALLLDAGDGTIRQLIRWYDDPSYVETIIISHTHADHAAGLFSILQWMHLLKRREKLTLCLPHPFFKNISTLFDAFWIDRKKWSFSLNIIELKEGQEIQNGPVFFIPVSNSHLDSKYLSMTGTSFSFIMKENQKKIIYTADVAQLSHLQPHISGTDLLICECTHIMMKTIRDFVTDYSIPEIVLTHIPPVLSGCPLPDDSSSMRIASDGVLITI